MIDHIQVVGGWLLILQFYFFGSDPSHLSMAMMMAGINVPLAGPHTNIGKRETRKDCEGGDRSEWTRAWKGTGQR